MGVLPVDDQPGPRLSLMHVVEGRRVVWPAIRSSNIGVMSSPKNPPQPWQYYETVAIYLLDEIASVLGLARVEGCQKLVGSVTNWNVDGKGVKGGAGEAFVIIEFRRHTTAKVDQEEMGGLAYRIFDTGAAGGIIVTPLGLQEGAERVASAANITSVRLDANSTCTEYLLSFLNNIFCGISDVVGLTDEVIIELIPGDESRGESVGA